MADMATKGRQRGAERPKGQAKLSDDEVREIRALYGQESNRSLGRRFGVAASAICRVGTGQTYAWVSS